MVTGLKGLFEEVSGKKITLLQPNEVIGGDQSRTNFNNIDELAKSIQTHGQIQPITVSPKNAAGKYVIRSGERRWRACQELGIPVEAVVTANAEEDQAMLKAAELVENIQREPLTPLETAHGLQELVDTGASQAEISRLLGKNQVYVSIHLALLRLPEEAKALAEEGVLSDPDTLNNLRKIHEIDEDVYRAACDEARAEGLSRGRSREILNSLKRPQPPSSVGTPPQSGAMQPTSASNTEQGEGSEDRNSLSEVGLNLPAEDSQRETYGIETDAVEFNENDLGQGVSESNELPPGPSDTEQPPEPLKKQKKVAEPRSTRGDGWTELNESAIAWQVMFTLDSETESTMGTLMVNRIDDDPAFVWVKTAEEEIRVQAEDLVIVRAEQRKD